MRKDKYGRENINGPPRGRKNGDGWLVYQNNNFGWIELTDILTFNN